MRFHLLVAVVLIALSADVRAAQSVQTLPVVEVRTSKKSEPVDRPPPTIIVVIGAGLNSRGVSNMASALDPVPGVEASAGGDAGPSSAVPSFRGLHEFDAFLPVVDGVPWGGAFNPVITTFGLNDVQRIVSRRLLGEENTAPVGGYTTLGMIAGYRFERYAVSLEGSDLGNRRPPLPSSEFGSASFSLLNGRTAWLKLGYCLDGKRCG